MDAMGTVRAAECGIDISSLGMPGFDRRLTDKILAAFNHAYAVGDVEVARRLHTVLALAEDHERGRLPATRGAGAERRSGGAVDQADLWVAYVEARNGYQALCQAGGADSAEARAAIEAMKRAYQRWSNG
jgi:hypothetical protein